MIKTEEFVLRKSGREYQDKFSEHFYLRQLAKKKTKNNPRLTVKQAFLDDYADRLSQLEFTRTRLGRFPKFLSSFHSALEKQGISRVAQFIYHLENYLAVVYIFDQRVKRLVKFVEKLAVKLGCPQADIEKVTDAKEILIASVEPLVKVRGNHTHEKYFFDYALEEMEKYDKAGEFTTNLRERKIFKNSAKTLLNLQRKRWKKDINGDIDKCEIQLGVLYAVLDKLVWQVHVRIK